jgi:hypothetical protein
MWSRKKTIEFGLPVTESEGINSNNNFTSSSAVTGIVGAPSMNFRDTDHLAVQFDPGLKKHMKNQHLNV